MKKPRRTFTIYVFPYVKKFISKTLPHQRGVYLCEETTLIGKYVKNLLTNKKIEDVGRGGKGNSLVKDRLTESITIQLTARQARLSPRVSTLQRLNFDLDTYFKHQLLMWITAQGNTGYPAYTACKAFLQHYGIDESEYSLDNAYKLWQRSRSLSNSETIPEH